MRRSERGHRALVALLAFLNALAMIAVAPAARELSLIWPANALLIVILVHNGSAPARAIFAGVAAAAGAAFAVLGEAAVLPAAYAAANGVEVAIAAALLLRWGAPPHDLRALAIIVACVTASAVASTALATIATIAAGVPIDTSRATVKWLIVDLLSPVIILPGLLAVSRSDIARLGHRPVAARGAGIVALTTALALAIFATERQNGLYLLTPLGVFAAFRLRTLGAALSTLSIATVATIATFNDSGPIGAIAGERADQILTLHLFVGVVSLTAFPAAMLIEQWREGLRAVEAARRGFRLIAEHSSDIIVRVAADGTQRYISPAMQRVLGHAPAALEGLPFSELAHPDDRPRVDALIGLVLAEQGEAGAAYRVRASDNRYYWVEASLRFVADDGSPEIIADIRDISERRDAEQQAIRSAALIVERERVLEMAEAVARLGHWRLDAASKQLFWSPQVYRIYGLPTAYEPSLETLGTRMRAEDSAMVRAHVERALAEGVPFACEARLNHADGSGRWASIRGRAERAPNGKIMGLWGVVHDITEQVAAMDELREARRTAERALEAKANFTATISHEIRTPLTSILGAVALLRRSRGEAAIERGIATIEHAGRLLADIVDDVLLFSRLDEGRLVLDERPFEPAAVVEAVAAMFAQAADERGLSLVTDYAHPMPLQIGDPARVERVLTNLVGNAIKFTDRGSVSIGIATEPEAGRLRFTVEDSGIGIAADRAAAIFEPFTQADARVAVTYGGSGLGLAICRRLVEAMGGTIGLESETGRGSRFWFKLPLRPVAAADEAGAAAPRGLHVVLAEDNPTNRFLLAEMIRSLGHRVDTVADGAAALDAVLRGEATATPVDCLLLDLRMPVMDGFEACRRVRALGPVGRLPVYALTAGTGSEKMARAADAGFDAVLAKPVDLRTLDRLLRGGRSNQPNIERPPRATVCSDFEALSVLGDGARAKLLGMFVENLSTGAARIATAMAERDAAALASEAHALRGAAMSVGAHGLAQALGAIEQAGDAGGLPVELHEAFSHEVAETLRHIRQMLETRSYTE
ncbi:ATP-binding protein [Sphingomonas baiyangensis]|nr:ATP-binding protein [Sphingomonas baiyangensis]